MRQTNAGARIRIPSHEELQLPLLNALDQEGPLTPAQATAVVGELLHLPTEVVHARKPMPSLCADGLPVLQHRLRWVRQEMVQRGFIESPERGIWSIAQRGRKFLLHAKPGVVISVFETDLGIALWAEAQSAVAAIEDRSLQLCFSSPPYPIASGRNYGVYSEEQCIQLVCDFCARLKPKLSDDASLYLNLGNVTLTGGEASLYQQRIAIAIRDRLGYAYIQPHAWVSLSKPPTNHYVTRTRTRLKDGFEMVYQFGKTANIREDTRTVLEPYKATMIRTLARGGDARASRPSRQGHFGNSFAKDNGGAIPPNVQIISNARSNSEYHRAVRARRLPLHPATFPEELPERAIRMNTAPGELVGDFFAGSLTVPRVCERLGRQWVACDLTLEYLRGGETMFKRCDGYQSHHIEGAIHVPPEWARP